MDRREFMLRVLKASAVSVVGMGGIGLTGCRRSVRKAPSEAALSVAYRQEPIDADPYKLRTSTVTRDSKPIKIYRAMTDEEMDRIHQMHLSQAEAVSHSPIKQSPPSAPSMHPDRGWDVSLRRAWRHIVVHHSAVSRGNAAMYDRAHRSRGWSGLGYHFVVGNGTDSGDGEVEVGARWREQRQGAHAGNREYNGHGVGVCLVGNLERTKPTQKQMASLQRLVGFLQQRCDIGTRSVIGHREVPKAKTVCPGRHLDLAGLRLALAQGANSVPRWAAPSSKLMSNGAGL